MTKVVDSMEQEVNEVDAEMTLAYGIKPWELDTVMFVYKYRGSLVILPQENMSLKELLADWHDEWKASETVVDRFSIRDSSENVDMGDNDLKNEDFLYVKGLIDALYKEEDLCKVNRETIVENWGLV